MNVEYYRAENAAEAASLYAQSRMETGDDEGRPVRCDVCDAVEFVSDQEVTEETLEGAGWYLGPVATYCPDHNEEEGEDDE
jgi:hypothetical protein